MTRPFAIPFALAAVACAQTLVEPERTAEIRQAFDQPAGGALRCEISPVKPVLTFAFRFQAGYQLRFPLSQFSGPGHRISVHVRITPEGRPPLFLTTAKVLPEVPDVKADAVEDGVFEIGEGAYAVDLLVLDNDHRSCRSSWRLQVHRNGSEQEILTTTPALTVTEPGAAATAQSPNKAPDIARLTILLNAAPMSPNRPKLQEEDIEPLTSSVASILRQWPARSVRLIAFSLPQRSIVFRNDKFNAAQIEELGQRLQNMELGAVDYHTLAKAGKPLDLLATLLSDELGGATSADAVLILGPHVASREDDLSQAPEKRLKPSPIFYLQYLPVPRLGGRGFDGTPPIGSAGRGPIHPSVDNMPMPAISMAAGDGIQKLVSRLKGETMPIRTPHDLAEAIHRIDPRISRTVAAAEVAHEAPKQTPAEPPSTVQPPEPAKPPTSEADPIDVLAALRDRVLEHGHGVPNHTCVETVNRSRFAHTGQAVKSCDTIIAGRRKEGAEARLRLATTDRLRLDVAMSTEREIYSWAGANQFEDRDIDEIVPLGAMGTGPFASFLLSVFMGRPPRFVFEDETTLNGRPVYQYSFEVPKPESHFRFKARREWLVTGYSGSLFVDPSTSDLMRLVIRTEELPPETETCEVDTTLDYGKVKLSGGQFLLPSSTTQRFVGRDGDESENVYTFASCRDFQAESRIDFGERTRNRETAAEAPAASPYWAAGLPVLVEVLDSIDSATAAAGDRIRGRVVNAVRDERGRTVIAEGTPVAGRLMRVEVRHPSPEVTIALRWETLELGGQTVPLNLDPNRKLTPGTGVQLGGIASLAGLKRRGVTFELPLPGEERFGVYRFPGKHAVMETGTKTEWVTAKR
jgi:hypothetical protein